MKTWVVEMVRVADLKIEADSFKTGLTGCLTFLRDIPENERKDGWPETEALEAIGQGCWERVHESRGDCPK